MSSASCHIETRQSSDAKYRMVQKSRPPSFSHIYINFFTNFQNFITGTMSSEFAINRSITDKVIEYQYQPIISRSLAHGGQCGEVYDDDVLQSTHDQPSEDVLYVVKHTLYAVERKLYEVQILSIKMKLYEAHVLVNQKQ